MIELKIGNALLKNHSKSQPKLLHLLFNLIANKAIFPIKWKISKIAPIFKDGDKQNVSSYRAISPLWAVLKQLEKLIFEKLAPIVYPTLTPDKHKISFLGNLFTIYVVQMDAKIFPIKWKTSKIAPIFKDGDKQNVSNYRPLSLLSAVLKLIEKLIFEKLAPIVYPTLTTDKHKISFLGNLFTNYVVQMGAWDLLTRVPSSGLAMMSR